MAVVVSDVRVWLAICLALTSWSDSVDCLALQPTKICQGTNFKLSQTGDADSRYRQYQRRYSNCTYVEGNLEVNYLDGQDGYDLSFLREIEEVTGYVLIVANHAEKIPLTSLRLIRGYTTYNYNNMEYALYVASNFKHGTPIVHGLKELQLPALTEILSGNVKFHDNYLLCYTSTINWDDILPTPNPVTLPGGVQNVNWSYSLTWTDPSLAVSKCPCSAACGGHCWGTSTAMCQQFTKVICSPQCGGHRCLGPLPNQCCFPECAAGCSGPGKSDCWACRNVNNGGECHDACPREFIYNQRDKLQHPNPLFKYTYGSLCVSKCPAYLLADGPDCVQECRPERVSNEEKKCVPCNGPCPKQCDFGDEVFVNSTNIQNFTNCYKVKGNIQILQPAFVKSSKTPAMRLEQLSVLESVVEVTGFVHVEANIKNLTSLSFLKNLKIIRGRSLFKNRLALYIYDTQLKSLDLNSLTTIENGNILIYNNTQLCYADTVNWTKLLSVPDTQTFNLRGNRNGILCENNDAKCARECSKDGCWNSHNDQCLSCARVRFGKQCLMSCDDLPKIYQNSSTECHSCDPECLTNCSNSLANSCDACVHYRDGDECVNACPITKYPDENNICQLCHSNCDGGCTGPANAVGDGACNSCHIAEFHSNNQDIFQCLPLGTKCKDGYFQRALSEAPLVGKRGCLKCHEECATCSEYGLSYCDSCVNLKAQEVLPTLGQCERPHCSFQCVSFCSDDRYHAPQNDSVGLCLPCDVHCHSKCTGPSASECIRCKQYTLFADEENRRESKFNCTEKCPDYSPHIVTETPEDGTTLTYCATKDPNLKNKIIIIVCSVIAGCIIIGIIITVIICVLRKRAKSEEEKTRMAALMHGVDEALLLEPMKPTSANPDLANLRLIKEFELKVGAVLGSGAFGTVFKGFWYPENEHIKIPVAIKILTDTSTAHSEELLEEARIMASVHHEHCLRILAFCMSKQMMLVTQLLAKGCLLDYIRGNSCNIGSKVLLNWSVQIGEGMNYLEDRKIVHRDLAARNVLVQRDDYVKITDFGLSKLLNFDENFVKVAEGKMPIKWLALESIQHRIFTSKSDVWSYGVTLWEMFTYGKRPYEGVDAFRMSELLEKGERLSQPSICTIDVYMLMIKCWVLDADSRPSFKYLSEEFKKMARDPGRYLVIEGDDLMRLPSHRDDQQELMRSISLPVDDQEPIVSADDYLQPRTSQAERDDDVPDSPWRPQPYPSRRTQETFPLSRVPENTPADKSALWEAEDQAAEVNRRRRTNSSEVQRREKHRNNPNSPRDSSCTQGTDPRQKSLRYTSDPCRVALEAASSMNARGREDGNNTPTRRYPSGGSNKSHPLAGSPPSDTRPIATSDSSDNYPYVNEKVPTIDYRQSIGRNSSARGRNLSAATRQSKATRQSELDVDQQLIDDDSDYLQPRPTDEEPNSYLDVVDDDDNGANQHRHGGDNTEEYLPMSPGPLSSNASKSLQPNNGQCISNPEYFEGPSNGWPSSGVGSNSGINTGKNALVFGRFDPKESKNLPNDHRRTDSTDSSKLYYNDLPGRGNIGDDFSHVRTAPPINNSVKRAV